MNHGVFIPYENAWIDRNTMLRMEEFRKGQDPKSRYVRMTPDLTSHKTNCFLQKEHRSCDCHPQQTMYIYSIYLWPPPPLTSLHKRSQHPHTRTHSDTVHSNKHIFINHIAKVQNMFWGMSCLCEALVFMKWYLERRFMVHMWNDMTYHHNHTVIIL